MFIFLLFIITRISINYNSNLFISFKQIRITMKRIQRKPAAGKTGGIHSSGGLYTKERSVSEIQKKWLLGDVLFLNILIDCMFVMLKLQMGYYIFYPLFETDEKCLLEIVACQTESVKSSPNSSSYESFR